MAAAGIVLMIAQANGMIVPECAWWVFGFGLFFKVLAATRKVKG